MNAIWNSDGKVSSFDLGKGLVLFSFSDQKDKERVLQGRPCLFDKNLVLFKELGDNDQIDQVILNQSPFWIQVFNIPIMKMTKKVGEVIVNSLGALEYIDVHDGEMAWGRYMRIRVNIDVTKEL